MITPPAGIKALPNGQWVLENDTHLSRWAEEHGSVITDPYLFKWLKPHLEGVKRVWDLGANIGDTARWYLDQGYDVVAVEPNPLVFQCLEHNCNRALCLNIAASDHIGTLKFTQLANVGASRVTEHGEMEVSAYPMDLLDGLAAPDFIKADLEGWELHAFRGMVETLRDSKPILFYEVNQGALAANGHTADDLKSFLVDLGYTEFTIYPPDATEADLQYDVLAKHK